MKEFDEHFEPLTEAGRADNPFRMPEGYIDSFEDRLMQRIAQEEAAPSERRRPIWSVLKPALTLAAMFALIFGMGYGVLSLTHTLDRGASTGAEGYATVEEPFIKPSSLINYYQMEGQAEEPEEIDEETLVDYLATSLSFADLADIYAQLY